MHGITTVVKDTLKTIARMLCEETIHLGTDTYTRRFMLPNYLPRSSKHEAFLDDIYGVVLMQKEGAIIDVGVNTGQTLLKMLSLDKSRPYFGFEPQSTLASCVDTFVIENKITHYCILPIALSDHNGSVSIYMRSEGIDPVASSVASTVDGFRPRTFYKCARRIYAVRGDEIIDSLDIESIALINIDVEGAELEVVRGLNVTIETHRPFIVFEVLHHYIVMTKEALDKETIDFRESRIQELEQIIRSNGYRVYQINGGREVIKTERIRPKVVNDLASTNYIAVPEEYEKEFCGLIERSRHIRTG